MFCVKVRICVSNSDIICSDRDFNASPDTSICVVPREIRAPISSVHAVIFKTASSSRVLCRSSPSRKAAFTSSVCCATRSSAPILADRDPSICSSSSATLFDSTKAPRNAFDRAETVSSARFPNVSEMEISPSDCSFSSAFVSSSFCAAAEMYFCCCAKDVSVTIACDDSAPVRSDSSPACFCILRHAASDFSSASAIFALI